MRFREEALTQLRERATRIPNEPRMPSGLGDLSFDYGTQFTDETIRTGKNAPTGRFEFRGVDISPEIRRVAMEEQFKTGFETGITGSITPRAGISFSAGKIFSIRPISQNKQFSAMKIKPFTTTAVNQIVSPIQLTKQDSVVIQTPVPIQTQIPTQRTTNITNNFGNPGFGGIPGLGGPTGGIRPPPLLPTAFFAPSVGVGSGRSGSSRGGRRRGTRVTQTLVGFSLGLKSPLSGGKGRIFSGLELTR